MTTDMPTWNIVKIGRRWHVTMDGKQDVRVLPCKTFKEAGEALDKLLERLKERREA